MTESKRPAPLVLRFGALGDTVLLTAMLRDLADRWGAPCDVVTGAGPQRRVLAGLPFVGNVLTLPSRRWPYLAAPSQWRLVRRLARRRPSPVWVFDRRPKAEWLVRRSGIPAEHVTSSLRFHRPPLEHLLDFQRRWAVAHPPAWRDRGPAPRGRRPARCAVHVPDEDRAECEAWLRGRGLRGHPLVLVQSSSRRATRGRWPVGKWAETIRAILDELGDARVLLLGAPSEAAQVEPIRLRCADPRVANVAGELSLDRLFALLSLADSCISVDTGPAHVAAAVECPVVVIPGAADPRRNAPRGRPGRVRIAVGAPETDWPDDPHAWTRWHRMERVPVRAVLDAWRESLIGWRDPRKGPPCATSRSRTS